MELHFFCLTRPLATCCGFPIEASFAMRRSTAPATGLYLLVLSFVATARALAPICPKISPATGLKNQFYSWKEGQQIRYQSSVSKKNRQAVLFVHGLFVNSDHWRKSLQSLAGDFDVYAIDLFGCGYSDKPESESEIAQLCNGEQRRFGNEPSVLPDITLGTAAGGSRVSNVDLRHPLRSPYNFYTWADLIADFCKDIVGKESTGEKVTLVCNSIGTISALQAVLDHPTIFNGVFAISPNYRELHEAEVPFRSLSMPVIRTVQRLLRENGQGAYDALTKPPIIKNILMEPYAITSAVDDTLVQVLLDPLLTPGSSRVVFDTLSYSAGPLPEQQLQEFPTNVPVWVCYGEDDPWTPGPRVEALMNKPPVKRVVSLPGAGHCPHDEVPEQVNPLLVEFLNTVVTK